MDTYPMVAMMMTKMATIVIVGTKTIKRRRDNRLEKD